MQSLPVIVTKPAARDLEEIVDFIAIRDLDAALDFQRKLIRQIQSLGERHPTGQSVRIKGQKNLRRIVFGNYNFYYRCEPERVVILAVLQGNRKFSKAWASRSRNLS